MKPVPPVTKTFMLEHNLRGYPRKRPRGQEQVRVSRVRQRAVASPLLDGRAEPVGSLGKPDLPEVKVRLLEVAHGFRLDATFFTRRFDLVQELVSRLPLEAGFRTVDMKSHPDYRAQAILRADAFQNKSTLTEDELNYRLRYFNHNHTGPIYHPEVDLCVMAEDGQFVAGCEALINAPCLEADVERVCTHSNFRKRGFARAVIQECLYRLKDMGIHNAYITGYSPEALALYGSLGAVDEVKAFFYELSI